MNPAGKGYGGRQKLPDNLKQLFRPVAMSRPDNELIAEVILYSEGFKNGEILGRKLVAIFNLARWEYNRFSAYSPIYLVLSESDGQMFVPRELLTPQQHYDWGLRALKTVLKACGSLLQQQRRSQEKGKSKSLQLFPGAAFLCPPHSPYPPPPPSTQYKQKKQTLHYLCFFFLLRLFFKLH